MQWRNLVQDFCCRDVATYGLIADVMYFIQEMDIDQDIDAGNQHSCMNFWRGTCRSDMVV